MTSPQTASTPDACPSCGAEWCDQVRTPGAWWRPIGSAPKDGTQFDAWVPDAFGGRRMCNLSFNWRGQLRQDGLLTAAELPRWPTHWRPLPTAPETGV